MSVGSARARASIFHLSAVASSEPTLIEERLGPWLLFPYINVSGRGDLGSHSALTLLTLTEFPLPASFGEKCTFILSSAVVTSSFRSEAVTEQLSALWIPLGKKRHL